MPDIDALTAVIITRLDEDQALAEAYEHAEMHIDYQDDDARAFRARFDETLILADVAAKRAILAAYLQAKADFDEAAPHAQSVPAFTGGVLTGHLVGLREAVTLLAEALGIEVDGD